MILLLIILAWLAAWALIAYGTREQPYEKEIDRQAMRRDRYHLY